MVDEPTRPAVVPVVIALAWQGDEQDHDRIGRLEYHPRGVARRMVESGEARWPDDPRNADDRWPIEDSDEGRDGQGTDVLLLGATGEAKSPSEMSKSELRAAIAGGDELPATLTRLELLARVRAAMQPSVESEPDSEPEPEPVAAEPAADATEQPTQQ